MANLITLNQYKQAKGLTGDKEDSKLNFLIPSVSQLIKTYCNNSLIDYAGIPKVESFDIEYFGIDNVQVSQSPILTVDLVEIRDSEQDPYYPLLETDFVIIKKSDIIKRVGGYSWPKGYASVRTTYYAGYAETPPELVLAAIDLVAYYLKEEYKQHKSIGTVSVQNITKSDTNINFPDHIRRVLDLYRHFD